MENRINPLMEQSPRMPDGQQKPVPSWEGKRVGRFKLISELGRGAMGRVFRAEDTLLQRHVALKVLPKVLRRGHKTIGVERLIAEARAAATLEHPNVVTVYEVNESSGVFYIAMELLSGGSLRDLIKAAGPMDYQRACLLCADAAEALAYAHAQGIVHRDVKPANLMLTRSGRCKVVDFGLARMEDAADLSSRMPESVGTPQFIASELLRGIPASDRSDIYSLGATLWYLLTGHPPFDGKTAAELLQQHLEAPLPDLLAIRPDLPSGLVQAISKAMSKRPADRYESAGQFEKVLRIYTIPAEHSATGSLSALMSVTEPSGTQFVQPIAAAPAGAIRWKPSQRVTIGAAAAVVLVIGAALIPMLGHGTPKTSRTAGSNLVPAGAPAAAGDSSAPRQAAPAPAPLPLDARALAERAMQFARRGQFSEAAADYAKAIQLDPSDVMNWYYRGCLTAYLGDKAAYREDCTGMFRQFSANSNVTIRDKTAKTCGLLPDSGVDPRDLLKVTDTLPADGTGITDLAAWFSMGKGLALYRAGEYDPCIEAADKALTPDRTVRASAAQLIKAMAQWQKGQHAEARSTLRQATDRMDRGLGRLGIDDLGKDGVEDWLNCQTLRRQAQKLIGPG